MSEEKLNGKIHLPIGELEDKINTKINGELAQYEVIRSPRDIKEVRKLCVMTEDLLEAIVRNIPLRSDPNIRPYENSKIKISLVEPKCFKIGQTFVLNRKLLELMTEMPKNLLNGFCYKGFSTLPPMEIYGLDAENHETLALYVPPIIEYHSGQSVLLDGIHRSFICKGMGAPINAVHVYNPSVELPFSPISWRKCVNAEEKPPKEKRYENLNVALFRDVTAVGIDG